MVFGKIFKKEGKKENDYVEIVPVETPKETRVWVRIFVLKDLSDVKAIVDTLREGNTIVLVDIRKVKDSKDVLELKKAISRIKSVVESIGGDIIGVGNEWIIATPSFARIYRGFSQQEGEKKETSNI